MSVEADIQRLHIHQMAMGEDLREVNQTLKKLGDALQQLAVLEQKNAEAVGAIARAHKRADDHEVRLRKLEAQMASNLWIERFVFLFITLVIGAWAKGVF